MIQHCRCDKQVRKRISDDPDLVGNSRAVRVVIHLARLTALPLRGSPQLEPPQIHPKCTTTAIKKYSVSYQTKGLTKMPTAKAPSAPMTENYGEGDKVVLELMGTKLPDRWWRIATMIFSR
jgi:hypothetical protein